MKGKGWAAVEEGEGSYIQKLQEGDLLFTDASSSKEERWRQIVAIREKFYEVAVPMYTLSLDESMREFGGPEDLESCFFADGILVHNGVRITVKLEDGREAMFVVDDNDTIKSLKKAISRKWDIPVSMQRMMHNEKVLKNSSTFRSYYICKDATVKIVLDMGIGAGGRIAQKIVKDTHPMEAYDFDTIGRVFIHLANADLWQAITGKPMPPTPISSQTYTSYGYPWFKLWEKDIENAAMSDVLAGIISVKEKLIVNASLQTDGSGSGETETKDDRGSSSSSSSSSKWKDDILAEESIIVPGTQIVNLKPLQGEAVEDGEW